MRGWRLLILLAALFLAVQPLALRAVTPDEVLPDPALEARARAISAGLRCMICQNQSIDESDADLARDLRVLVRQRLVAGDTDDEVIAYVVSRYGEFVLLKPVFNWRNALLWGTPVLLLLAGGGYILLASRRRRPVPAEALSDEEKAALAAALRREE
ncbi:cytochrome c-type biogenesis protein [Mesorhizobium australicum]|uniref:Cytochrome c-type biogenesis protein n=1 Tax=Mesorhizobium australicum TaxID=536018 RepID=A0A1X7NYE0_9HYPH|nr:cytochrome c-type biogenesis protein [Mesorhizobium australicum]SMH42986.1 cytochrome c-type biogenesis protein CcmH [Mesorhizobium australicum]